MDDLDDELDLRYHRGVKPDVYYRAPNTESLDAALWNELERNASSLIPSDIVTEFVFAAASTITIPVTLQAHLDALIEPQEYAQSIQVEYVLCRDFDIKEKLKIQRAVSKSIIAAIEEADGFKYSERHSHNPKNGDGVRLPYVCQDSLENRDRKANKKKKDTDPNEIENETARGNKELLPTYDCGGAIHVKFSTKRDAINVVYKHNPIHRDVESRRNGNTDMVDPETNTEPLSGTKISNGSTKKRKRSTKDRHTSVDEALHDPDVDMSTSPEAPKSSARRKRKSNGAGASAEASKKSKANKSQVSKTTKTLPNANAKKAAIREPSSPPRFARNKACVRCRERKIKCNEAKPSCNQLSERSLDLPLRGCSA